MPFLVAGLGAAAAGAAVVAAWCGRERYARRKAKEPLDDEDGIAEGGCSKPCVSVFGGGQSRKGSRNHPQEDPRVVFKSDGRPSGATFGALDIARLSKDYPALLRGQGTKYPLKLAVFLKNLKVHAARELMDAVDSNVSREHLDTLFEHASERQLAKVVAPIINADTTRPSIIALLNSGYLSAKRSMEIIRRVSLKSIGTMLMMSPDDIMRLFKALEQDGPGMYVTLNSTVVTETVFGDSKSIAQLEEGRQVSVVEVHTLGDYNRIRARLQHPNGWITLVNMEDNCRCATRVKEAVGSIALDLDFLTLPEQLVVHTLVPLLRRIEHPDVMAALLLNVGSDALVTVLKNTQRGAGLALLSDFANALEMSDVVPESVIVQLFKHAQENPGFIQGVIIPVIERGPGVMTMMRKIRPERLLMIAKWSSLDDLLLMIDHVDPTFAASVLNGPIGFAAGESLPEISAMVLRRPYLAQYVPGASGVDARGGDRANAGTSTRKGKLPASSAGEENGKMAMQWHKEGYNFQCKGGLGAYKEDVAARGYLGSVRWLPGQEAPPIS